MKVRKILFTTLCSLMIGNGFTACSNNDDEPTLTPDPAYYRTYILNEGLWEANNANITSFVPQEQVKKTYDIYALYNNNAKMGDVANDIIQEDDYIYVVLNGSKYVSKLDLYCREQARYAFPKGDGAPRCIEVEDGFAYVTQYGGKVSKLNIKDMTLVDTFEEEDNLEGIVEKDGKLYVANSYKGINDYNQEVFVIDTKTMTKTKTIDVVKNPTKIYNINDKIYLISQGNYVDIASALQVIDPETATSKVIIQNATKITEGFNGLIYGICSTYDEFWQLTNSFFTYNPKTEVISETSFLQETPASFKTDAIYLLEIDEKNGYIYIGTTDYKNSGTIYQFDKNGVLIQSFDSGGINPSAMIFSIPDQLNF